MTKRSTTVRKRFVRKLGVTLNRYFKEPKYSQLVFEEWPLIDESHGSVVFIKLLDEDGAAEDDCFSTTLSRSEATELIAFLEYALERAP